MLSPSGSVCVCVSYDYAMNILSDVKLLSPDMKAQDVFTIFKATQDETADRQSC